MKKKAVLLSLILILLVAGIIGFYIIFPSQSQIRSRVFGGAVDLDVPSDCKKIVFISFAHDGKETKKYLTYINTQDELITREYRDYKLFEGKIRWKGFNKSMIEGK